MTGARRIIHTAIQGYWDHEALTRGAAIAFYAVTAIAPTLYIAVTVASLGFGREAARGAVAYQLRHMMSPQSADVMQAAVRNAGTGSGGIARGLFGFFILILTASGVFAEMEDALNVVWHAPRKGNVLLRLLRGRAVSLMLIVGLGFFLLVSMLFTALIAALGHYVDRHTPFSQAMLQLLNLGISTAMLSLLFAAIFKVLPNMRLEWRDVAAGAIATALLFQIGQGLLAWYLARSSIATPYGAAGGMIVLLLWVYYLAQVFLFGAELTKAYAGEKGSLAVRIAESTSTVRA